MSVEQARENLLADAEYFSLDKLAAYFKLPHVPEVVPKTYTGELKDYIEYCRFTAAAADQIITLLSTAEFSQVWIIHTAYAQKKFTFELLVDKIKIPPGWAAVLMAADGRSDEGVVGGVVSVESREPKPL